MKIAFIFIAVLALVFANYTDPPISLVSEHNNAISLIDIVPDAGFGTCTVESDTSLLAGRSAVEALELKVVSLFPAVDNRISSAFPPSAYWAFGEKHKESISWETELSGNTCTSNAYFVKSNHSTRIGFMIGNNTYYAADEADPMSMPSEAAAMLETANGKNLTVRMDGNAVFTYDLEVYSVVCTPNSGCSCEKNSQASGEKNLTFHCENSVDYEIETQPIVRLLQKPVLKEQWYKNNHFDNLVLANRKIYKAGVEINGSQFGAVTFYSFDVKMDKYGLESIVTIDAYSANGAEGKESTVNAVPVPLQVKNDTFRYAYEVNSSYSGLGWNTLTLKAYDDFGQEMEADEQILSRELSFSGNISESNSETKNTQTLRPSSEWSPLTYNLAFITLGAVGMLAIFAVFRMRIFS
jgi:hypothetical protein